MIESILLITDNHTHTHHLQEGLQRAGLVVEVASISSPGLEAIPRYVPTAIVLDVQAFDRNSYLMCQMLKANLVTHHIPLIVITESYQPGEVLMALQAGADDCIPKDGFARHNVIETLRYFGKLPAALPCINVLELPVAYLSGV